ncbi:MAG: GGDEF domain-containing protein [Butyrivibrio sp.]|nr:GGDEF domain-containing protein [Butyrivibrio sp.]
MNLEIYNKEIQNIISNVQAYRIGNSTKFLTECRKLLTLAKKLSDDSLMGYAYYYLSEACYMSVPHYNGFFTNLLKGIEHQQSASEYELLARSYNMLAVDALNHGSNELGLDYFLTALRFSSLCPDHEQMLTGIITYNIGQTYIHIKDYKNALKYTRQARKYINHGKKDSAYQRNYLYVCCTMGICYIKLGKLKQAITISQQISSLLEKWGNPEYLIRDTPYYELKIKLAYSLDQNEIVKNEISGFIETIKAHPPVLDALEDIFNLCEFLVESNEIASLGEILSILDTEIQDFNIYNIMISYARILTIYYSASGEIDKAKETSYNHFKYLELQRKETIKNYNFYMDLRTKMEVVKKENEILLEKVSKDPLTGISNRYLLNEYGDIAFDNASRNNTLLGFELLDIDYFKEFNDTYGHQEGDELLKKIAAILQSICCDTIHCFRYGGDEFVVIYEGYTDEEINVLADTIRTRITNLKIKNSKTPSGYASVSQGIRNSVPAPGNKLWDYMYAADNALYEVKKSTKGEIVLIHKATISTSSLNDAQRT